VVVKGADEVDYQNMINVLDVLQQLDITKVGLATEAETPLKKIRDKPNKTYKMTTK